MMFSDYTKEFSYNWRLAAPVIMGMLGHTIVGLVDNLMVGQLGAAELAAVSLGNSFFFVAMSIGIGFSTAITPLVAEADSEHNFAKGKSAFKHGFVLCSLLAIVLFALILLAKPLMYMMNQPQEVVVLALPYLDIIAISLVPLIIFQALKQFSDGMSLTKFPMYATIIANVINVFFNYVLIFGVWGFPKMGVVGAGIGTLIARFVMIMLMWYFLNRLEKTKAYVKDLKLFVLEHSMLKKINSLGLPSALQMFFEVGLFTAAIWLSGTLGKNPQAANQIALNLSSMTFMIATGLSVTAMIRVGNQKGLKRPVELRRIATSIFIMGLALAILFALIFLIFNNVLPTFYLDLNDLTHFADNQNVVEIASSLLIIAALFQISDSTQVVFLGALRGLQDVKIPTLITFFAYWIIGFPVSYFLGDASKYGSSGIWIGLLAGLTASSIFLYIRFNYLSKQLIAKELKA
ncbi:MATE family efflux transporter [Flavobacteriaceae bacterium]|uniref:MATE family efflux transporter n=1 Tax=Formosa sp. Hel3_A1_48 TaxID=1336795 RepID=UPI00084E12B0|nr:MATE family efflux transporter [Formosa sp. Hel3_A1_48]MDC0950971.1 MATE family efflux transporter [Flavobacteriaceae bacterium]